MECFFMKGENPERGPKPMAGERLQDILEVKEKTIKKACYFAMEAHRRPGKPFVIRRRCRSSNVIFAFPGTWSAGDWFSAEAGTGHFGETKVDLEVFPSLRSIGSDEVASVNGAFLRRFLSVVEKPVFRNEVEKALKKKKRIIFTGHSGGAPIAIYSTVWLLEYLKRNKIDCSFPLCLTFGSPLIADRIFRHALRREAWADSFIHFVTRYDVVPRIMLAPPSQTQQILPKVLSYVKSSQDSMQASMGNDGFVEVVFETIMRNASSIASQAACNLMGSTNRLVDTVSGFIELSPYRPFGTYVFCYGKGKLLTAKNPEAVLQLLIHSAQLSSEADGPEIARASLSEHSAYEIKLKEISANQSLYCFEKFRELPLSSEECSDSEAQTINMVLDDLGLSTRARLCLRATRESENQKTANRRKIDAERVGMEEAMAVLEGYRASCEARGVGYYDSFKQQKYQEDFLANTKRLELAGWWDEIVEMLKRQELPDGFEGEEVWIELGTKYRRLVEPLDIANYYRKSLYEDTVMYMKPGSRPKRYWHTQRWHEHLKEMPRGSSGESCFWAEVEQLRMQTEANGTAAFDDVRERVLQLEKNLEGWYEREEVRKDAFLPESTLVKWWKTLPSEHRAASRIGGFIGS